MDEQTKNKKDFLRNDRKLVCSMLIVYGLCICGLIAATLWGLDRRNRRISANATSTAAVAATRQAIATATVAARLTEQAQYEVVDRFNTNKNDWRTEREVNDYWNGYTTVEKGVYRWKVNETKETFISWADFSTNDRIRDFDVYVDTKVVKGGRGDVCSGFLFRIPPVGWDAGGYYFALCNDSQVRVRYHTEKEGWENIAGFPYRGRSKGWNRLEVSARTSHFTFFINGEQVYELEDDRQKVGGLALVIELNEKVSAEVLFDNFGFQTP